LTSFKQFYGGRGHACTFLTNNNVSTNKYRSSNCAVEQAMNPRFSSI